MAVSKLSQIAVQASPAAGDFVVGVNAAKTTDQLATITSIATAMGLSVAGGKTLTASNTLTLTGTDGSSVAFGAGGTVSYTAGANPSASIGLSAVNGVATSFMRSDGAPALSQSIVPTWTGIHTFTPAATVSPAALTWAGPLGSGLNNTAGSWTFTAPLSTGNATNPDLILQTGVKIASGSGLATATTALTIKGETQNLVVASKILVPDSGGSLSTPSFAFSSETTTGILRLGTNFLGIASGSHATVGVDNTNIYLTRDASIVWVTSPTNANASFDSSIGRTASGFWAIGDQTASHFARFGCPATATLQHGDPDSASPVAQTIKFQSVVAGTSNTAGVNATFQASVGTGTGAGGQIILQTAPAGASGTSQNALATALTLTAPAVNMQPSVVVGNQALTTTATDGFLYIPTCAGAPTGVPTAFTGRVPMIYDSTNNNFYINNGGWKKTTTFA